MSNIFKDLLEANKITVITDGEKTIITCDVVTEEEHNMEAEATQYPIEDGSNISDHVVNRGKTIRIDGMVSDDPITVLQTGFLDRNISGIVPLSIKSKLGYGLSGDSGKPSKETFDQFEKIYDEKRPVTLITGLKKYENMIMESSTMPRSSQTVRSLKFTCIFRQINIMSTQMVAAPAVYQDVELGAQAKKNIGKQGTETMIENSDETFTLKFLSWMYNAFRGIVTGG